jgi:serine phosphatase RsbU (regulator of sigma subunit)
MTASMPAMAPSRPTEPHPTAAFTTDRGRVLVADDQPAVVDALRLLLKLHGYDVRAAGSPAAVLATLAEAREPFDLLVMDLNYARDTTSGEEGLELVGRVHAVDPDLPIVVMTAWSTVPLAVTAMRSGGGDFVEKPWDNARLVATVAAQIASGRIRRRAHRLETDARAVQHRLLGRTLPTVDGFTVGVAWSFAEALGGDAYAMARLPEGRLAVAIADVCGKGTPAALLMASAQATLEDLLAADLPPSEVCRRLSLALRPRLGPERFVSFVCAVLDPGRRTLRYANAGHPAPLLLAADGTARQLETGGPVLGIVSDAAYEDGVLPLAGGDRLALFTDGVIEASPGGEELGVARLLERLRDLSGAEAAPASAALLETARQFAGGALADDATVVVVDTTDRRVRL